MINRGGRGVGRGGTIFAKKNGTDDTGNNCKKIIITVIAE